MSKAAQDDLIDKIQNSPYMVAQRKQIQSISPGSGKPGMVPNGCVARAQPSLGSPGNVVQRTVAWKATNHPDNVLDAFAQALSTVVEAGAATALTEVDSLAGADGYTALWKQTAVLIVAAREGTLTPEDIDQALIARQFGPARYGYAVEAYANAQIATLQGALPNGYTFHIQASRGMTRPDFIVLDNHSAEVGWFDVTSDTSLGHIDRKTGNGWQARRYVAEISYVPLNTDNLSLGNAGIGTRVRARNVAVRAREAWAAFKNDRLKWFSVYYDMERQALSSYQHISERDNKNVTKTAMGKALYLGAQATDGQTKSVLRAFGVNITQHGFKDGGTKAEGETLLRTVQDNM